MGARLGRRVFVGSNVAFAAAGGLFAIALTREFGLQLLVLLPLAMLAALVFVRPIVALSLAAGGTILAETSNFGLFPFTEQLYEDRFQSLSGLDLLLLFAVAAVAFDLLRTRRPLRIPAALGLPLALLTLALLAGLVTGYAAGSGIRTMLFAQRPLMYLIVLPLAFVNLDADERTLRLLVKGGFAIALLKALLGVAAVVSGRGYPIDGSVLTYYEPTGNWIVLVALLGIVAALIGRMRPPLWLVLSAIPLLASLVLSFRRSFWIGGMVALVVVIVLAASQAGRRLIVPTALLVGVGIWLLGSIQFQSQSAIGERVQSLSPTRVEANAEDRYRLDERANVLAEIRAAPLSGLGIDVPWSASERPLPVEHRNGRLYTHVVSLYLWLKLGILGPLAYLALIAGAAVLSLRAWRKEHDPFLRCFGAASLSALAGLLVIETTASFTGVDSRFTVLFATQIGLLGALAVSRRAGSEPRS